MQIMNVTESFFVIADVIFGKTSEFCVTLMVTWSINCHTILKYSIIIHARLNKIQYIITATCFGSYLLVIYFLFVYFYISI